MGKCVRCSTIFDPNTKSKLSLFGVDYHRNCRKCSCHNFEVEPWSKVPEEIKKELIADFSKKPIREKIGESELDSLVKDSLKVCKYESEYNLIETDDYSDYLSIEPTENSFDLYYNPEFLRKFNDDQIKAMIRHEIFHPITMDVIEFPIESNKEITNQNMFLKIYAEMINYKKYVNQIPNDIELRKIKQGIAYDGILTLLVTKNLIHKHMQNGAIFSYDNLFYVLKSLELLIYYFYDNGKIITPLIKKYNLQAIWQLFSWINHDMSYIQKNIENVIGEDGIISYLNVLNAYVENLNFKKLFLENKIEFDKNFIEKMKQNAGKNKTELDKKLHDSWMKRALEYA